MDIRFCHLPHRENIDWRYFKYGAAWSIWNKERGGRRSLETTVQKWFV